MDKSDMHGNGLKKRLYTVKEASVYLGRSECAIRELIWNGAIPCVKIGRRVHIDIYDLERFIEKSRVYFRY